MEPWAVEPWAVEEHRRTQKNPALVCHILSFSTPGHPLVCHILSFSTSFSTCQLFVAPRTTPEQPQNNHPLVCHILSFSTPGHPLVCHILSFSTPSWPPPSVSHSLISYSWPPPEQPQKIPAPSRHYFFLEWLSSLFYITTQPQKNPRTTPEKWTHHGFHRFFIFFIIFLKFFIIFHNFL